MLALFFEQTNSRTLGGPDRGMIPCDPEGDPCFWRPVMQMYPAGRHWVGFLPQRQRDVQQIRDA